MPYVKFGTEQVYFGPDFVLFGDDAPPDSPGTSVIALYYDGVEVGALGWDMTYEEVLGGISRASIIIQDRENSDWEPEPHHDIKVVIRSSGWVLWRGETLVPTCKLVLGLDFRIWTIPCRDYGGFVSEALFGAPTGGLFVRPTDRDPYRSVDPDAVSHGTDQNTIQTWIAHYRPNVAGVAIDTASHVHDNGSPIQELDMQDSMTTLGGGIAALAALMDVNVQDWLCPDLHWHHVAVPSAVDLLETGDAGDLETAPIEIGPDGKGLMSLEVSWDGQAQAEQVYLQAATQFTFDDLNGPAAGASGFYPANEAFPNIPMDADETKRQAYFSAPSAWSRSQGITIANHVLRRGTTPTLRGSFTVEGVDGWRAGQVVTIKDVRLPDSLQGTHKFVVQRIATSLYPGTDVRQYQIDFGDGAVSRAETGGTGPSAAVASVPEAPVKKPVISYRITWVDENGNPNTNPIAANEERWVLVDTSNALGEEHQPQGVSITLGVVAIDLDPASPTFGDVIPAMGSFDPNPTTTDSDGRARSKFTAGSQDGLQYAPFAESELPQA